MAYEINHKAEGIYVVLDLTTTPESVAELDRQLNLNEAIVRTKVTAPLSAKLRPRPTLHSEATWHGDINITVVGNLTNDPELRFTPMVRPLPHCRV